MPSARDQACRAREGVHGHLLWSGSQAEQGGREGRLGCHLPLPTRGRSHSNPLGSPGASAGKDGVTVVGCGPLLSLGRTALSSPGICETWTESHRGANTPGPQLPRASAHKAPLRWNQTRPGPRLPSRTERLGAATRLSLALTVARQGAGATPAPEGLTWFPRAQNAKGGQPERALRWDPRVSPAPSRGRPCPFSPTEGGGGLGEVVLGHTRPGALRGGPCPPELSCLLLLPGGLP